MGRVYGGEVDFLLDSTQIEAWLDSATINFSVPVGDITSFSDTFQNVIAGKKNVTMDIAGTWDGDASAADDIIFGCIGAGVKTTSFEPGGGTIGGDNPAYNCAASGLVGTFISSYSISLPVGDKASFSASLQNSGLTERKTS